MTWPATVPRTVGDIEIPVPPPAAASVSLARPKSRILAWPSLVMKMLSGFRSRWTIPASWAAASASDTSRASNNVLPVGSAPLARRLAQGMALEVLLHHVVHAGGRQRARRHVRVGLRLVGTGAFREADVVHHRDVRVIEGRGGLGLLLEARQPFGVRGVLRRQHLDRHVAIEPRIAAEVHLAHATLAERFEDFVMTKGFADHRGLPVRGSRRLAYVQAGRRINGSSPMASGSTTPGNKKVTNPAVLSGTERY